MKISKTENILLNLSGGLTPDCLTKKEVALLRRAFGRCWFFKLGYTVPKYQRPRFRR